MTGAGTTTPGYQSPITSCIRARIDNFVRSVPVGTCKQLQEDIGAGRGKGWPRSAFGWCLDHAGVSPNVNRAPTIAYM